MIREHELPKHARTLTCFMAVTVMTKNRGSPLVIGEVGVSIINCKGEREDLVRIRQTCSTQCHILTLHSTDI